MLHAPLEQFQILSLIPIKIFNFDFSITNFLLINLLALVSFMSFIYYNGSNENYLQETSYYFSINACPKSSLIAQNKLKVFIGTKGSKIFSSNRITTGSKVSISMGKKNRSYHSTTFTRAPEWVLSLSKFLGMGKSTAPVSTTQIAMYPNIDSIGFVKTAFKSAVASFTDPIVWKLIIGVSSVVFITAVIGSSTFAIGFKIANVMDIVNVYNHIVADPDFVNFLNTSYTDLSAFNEKSTKLIRIKSLNRLSYEQCEVIVKFCIHDQNHMIFGVLIDTTNTINFR